MGKSPITWLELINQKLSALKKAGKSASIREVAPEAKAEWTKIKAGTHSEYTQGKAQTHARKHKKDKTQKMAKGKSTSTNTNEYSDADIKHILSTINLCGKCSKQMNNLTKKTKKTKKTKGGGSCNLPQYAGLQPLPSGTLAINQVAKQTGGASTLLKAATEVAPVVAPAATPVVAPAVAPAVAPVVAPAAPQQKGGNCGCGLFGGGKKHTKKCKANK